MWLAASVLPGTGLISGTGAAGQLLGPAKVPPGMSAAHAGVPGSSPGSCTSGLLPAHVHPGRHHLMANSRPCLAVGDPDGAPDPVLDLVKPDRHMHLVE